MQTLAVGCQSAFGVGMLPPGRFVPLALFPMQATFFDAALLVVVLWMSGAALPVHLALHPSFFPSIRC